jgi:predicted dehydrogenase
LGVDPVRWGLLSTARINAAVIPGLRESEESELVAVASRTEERAAAYAREWGIPRAHGTYEALLENPDVEAVYISIPNGPHVEWSVRALEAGKHVLALAGGSLMDVGCYCVSGSRLLAGEPEIALAWQVLGETGVDLRVAGTLVFPEDVLAQLDCAYDLPSRQGLEVVGSEGTLRMPTPWGADEPGIVLQRGDGVERIAVASADRYRLQSDNFSPPIRGLEPPLLGREDALGQARTIDALFRSAGAGGQPVQV